MSMTRALSAEFIKFRRSMLLKMAILLPLLLVALLCLQVQSVSDANHFIRTWSGFIQMVCAHWALFVLPVVVPLMATRTMAWEHQRDHWKILFSQGIPRTSFFMAKWIMVTALVLIAHLCLIFGLWMAGKAMGFPVFDQHQRLGLILLTVPVVLPIITIQLWLASVFRGFFPPMIFAFFGLIIGFLAYRDDVGQYFPWSYFFNTLQLRGPDLVPGSTYLLTGPLLGLILLAPALWWFSRPEVT